MDIQALAELAFKAKDSEVRNKPIRERPLTLEEVIAWLEMQDKDEWACFGLAQPHSYRGAYDHLAFELDYDGSVVRDLVAFLRSCEGRTFEGYKGGNFTMKLTTPVFIATYGSTGSAITLPFLEWLMIDAYWG